MYESGIINEHSIGFQYIEDKTKWIDLNDKNDVLATAEGQDFINKRNGYYEISEVKLWEGSYVTFGANSNTPVVKSREDQKKYLETINERMSLLRNELSNGTYSDNGFKSLVQELAYIQEQYNSLLSIEPVISTQKSKAEADQKKVREFLMFTLPNCY